MNTDAEREAQKLEIEALRSIYCNEFKLLRPKKKKINAPLKCSVYVAIRESDDPTKAILKSLKIIFDCKTYHEECPTITFEDVVNIDKSDLDQIIKLMFDSFENTELIIHSMVEKCRQYLRDLVDQQSKTSLSEQPQDNKTGIDVFHTQPTIKMDISQAEQCLHQYHDDSYTKPLEFVHSDKSSQPYRVVIGRCHGKHKVRVLDNRSYIVFNTFDAFEISQGHQVQIRQLCIKILHDRPKTQYIECQWLPRLHEDLRVLYRLSHSNLHQHLGHRFHVSSSKKKQQLVYIQLLLSNDITKTTLYDACCNQVNMSTNATMTVNGCHGDVRLSMSTIRNYIRQVCRAISYLHDRSLTFINVKMDSIFLDMDMQLKLTEFSIGKRIRELKSLDDADSNVMKYSTSQSHDADVTQSISLEGSHENNVSSLHHSAKKGSKKYDIIQLSKLCKSLYFFGMKEHDIDEADMPSSILDFCQSCYEQPDSIYNHSFVTQQYMSKPAVKWVASIHDNHLENAKGVLATNPSGGNVGPGPGVQPQHGDNSLGDRGSDVASDDLSTWRMFNQSTSRIASEFEVIESLGKGAFGDVVKVLNKFDNRYYAIKRVKLRHYRRCAEHRKLKEVQLLSSLNHENIVRYYSTWCEEISSVSTDPSGGDSSSVICRQSDSLLVQHRGRGDNNSSRTRQSLWDSNLMELSSLVNFQDKCLRMTFCDDEAASSLTSDDDDDEDGSLDDSSVPYHITNTASSDSLVAFGSRHTNGSNPLTEESDKSLQHPMVNNKRQNGASSEERPSREAASLSSTKYLMIQMELCEGINNTLRKVIEGEQLHLNEKLIWRFTREIVAGLDHLHSKSIIHRDLKPNNIFLDSARRIKLGDLGLATIYSDNNKSMSTSSGPVGTQLYICPEMIAHKVYDAKADMYSLGIILFEMSHPVFPTQSERYHAIGQLRSADVIFPESSNRYPRDKFRILIGQLLSHNPDQRPSSSELMKFHIIPPPEAREMELRNKLLEITDNPGSSLYKLLLEKFFTSQVSSTGLSLHSSVINEYSTLLYMQSPYKHFVANANYELLMLSSNAVNTSDVHANFNRDAFLDLINGDFRFFSVQRMIVQLVESRFQLHGAVALTNPLLHPMGSSNTNLTTNQQQDSCPRPITVLDREGTRLQLPTALHSNLRHYIEACPGLISCRYYDIGQVYCHQDKRYYGGYHPRQLTEAIFNIITPKYDLESVLESLYVLLSISNQLFNDQVQFCLHINHTGIVTGILEYFNIPLRLRSELLNEFNQSNHGQQTKPSKFKESNNVQSNLLDVEPFKSLLSESQWSFVRQLLQYRGGLDEYKKMIRSFVQRANEKKSCSLIQTSYDQLVELTNHLRDVEALRRAPPLQIDLLPCMLPRSRVPDHLSMQTCITYELTALATNRNTATTSTSTSAPMATSSSTGAGSQLAGDFHYLSMTINFQGPSFADESQSFTDQSNNSNNAAMYQQPISYHHTHHSNKCVKAIRKFLDQPKLIGYGNCDASGSDEHPEHSRSSSSSSQSQLHHNQHTRYNTTLTIDLSGLIQFYYFFQFVNIPLAEKLIGLTRVNVLVKWSAEHKDKVWLLLTTLWSANISAVVWNENYNGDIYSLSNQMSLLMLILHQSTKQEASLRIRLVQSHNYTMLLDEEWANHQKILQWIIDKINSSISAAGTLDGNLHNPYSQQTLHHRKSMIEDSYSASNHNTVSHNVSQSNAKYTYKFAYGPRATNNRLTCPELCTNYLAETSRHFASLQMKNHDLNQSDIKLVERANQLLITQCHWFDSANGRPAVLPYNIYVIFAELSLVKMNIVVSQLQSWRSSLVSSSSQQKLMESIVTAIEANQVSMVNQTEKNTWKDVVDRICWEIQNAAKEKSSRIMLYSIPDSHHVLLELK